MIWYDLPIFKMDGSAQKPDQVMTKIKEKSGHRPDTPVNDAVEHKGLCKRRTKITFSPNFQTKSAQWFTHFWTRRVWPADQLSKTRRGNHLWLWADGDQSQIQFYCPTTIRIWTWIGTARFTPDRLAPTLGRLPGCWAGTAWWNWIDLLLDRATARVVISSSCPETLPFRQCVVAVVVPVTVLGWPWRGWRSEKPRDGRAETTTKWDDLQRRHVLIFAVKNLVHLVCNWLFWNEMETVVTIMLRCWILMTIRSVVLG